MLMHICKFSLSQWGEKNKLPFAWEIGKLKERGISSDNILNNHILRGKVYHHWLQWNCTKELTYVLASAAEERSHRTVTYRWQYPTESFIVISFKFCNTTQDSSPWLLSFPVQNCIFWIISYDIWWVFLVVREPLKNKILKIFSDYNTQVQQSTWICVFCLFIF